ncbi:hypothetical protein [Microbacterium sp. CH12i]|nr:hypothetical protein [Microbacterium sp. CH12i]
MTEQLNLMSLVSSIASLVLAIVAIALAIVFFRTGVEASREREIRFEQH